MVYLHLPSNFTDEEIMLQNKYEKLKRKKKALQVLKAPRQEPERTTPVKRPQLEGRDAREIAKKLIKSGAIAAIKKAPKREEMSGFKRPRGLERRLERNPISGYQPFSGNNDQEPAKPKVKLYESLMADIDDNDRIFRREPTEKTGGFTLFVQGVDITEQMIRDSFAHYGNIINITMETEKSRGFVTYEDQSSASSAIAGLHKTIMNHGILKVSFARRQPVYTINTDATKNSKMWSNVANRKSEKGVTKEQQDREIVNYDNIFD